MKCIIIGAGEFREKEIIKEKDDLLILCDAGYNNYLKLDNHNIEDIDLLIGDFDSLDRDSVKLSEKTKIITLYPKKNDTDVLDACIYGLDKGYKDFHIYGCLGGRIEHSFANIQILSYLKEKKANGLLIDNGKIIRILKNESLYLSSKYNGYISIFSLIDESKGVTLRNLKYELMNSTLKESYPIGIDNEFINKESFIEVKNGKVLLIYNIF